MTSLEKLQYQEENKKKSAIVQFLDWYQENKLNEKDLKKLDSFGIQKKKR